MPNHVTERVGRTQSSLAGPCNGGAPRSTQRHYRHPQCRRRFVPRAVHPAGGPMVPGPGAMR